MEASTYITDRIDVDVIFRVGRMRDERLDQKLSQDTLYGFHLLSLPSAGFYPGSSFLPSLVQGQQAAFATTLDQLVGLCNELGPSGQQPWVGGLGLIEDRRNGVVFGEI